MSRIGPRVDPFTTSNPAVGTEQTQTPPAQVTIGQIPIGDYGANYVKTGNIADVWTDYQVMNRYENDKHIYMMGVASPAGFQGVSCAFVQLAAPTLLWIADWTALRWGSKPTIPSETPVDPNWVLLDKHIELPHIVPAADGSTPLWRITGTYVYGHTNPSPNILSNVNFGRPPWLADVYDRSVPTSLQIASIMDWTGVNT